MQDALQVHRKPENAISSSLTFSIPYGIDNTGTSVRRGKVCIVQTFPDPPREN
jgi:hypothetical protein